MATASSVHLLTLLALACCAQAQIAMHGGPVCAEMTPFCVDASAHYSFEFSSNNNQQTTGTYDNWGCLGSHPGEQWMYITIDQSGTFAMDTSSSQDHDFAVWGPFASLDAAIGTCGSLPATTDCSFSSSATERVQIQGAQPGEIYIYLLTNYARVTQDLTAGLASSSTASVSCAAVQALIDECSDVCDQVASGGGDASSHAIHGGAECAAMEPFCVDPEAHYNFEFSSSNNQQTTGTYDNWGCLGSHPGEQWMYITIDGPGNFAMITSSAQDHDYAVWGPFASLAEARNECGNLAAPTDCSFSSSATEHVSFSNAQAGDIYILVLTNYAQVTQGLTATLESTDTASVSCAAVDALLQRCADFCSSDGGGSPSPPSSTAGSFTVLNGPCTTDRAGQCVGRPAGYGNGESCTIGVQGQMTLGACPIFNTERSYDQLTIGGDDYDGNNCPQGIGLTASSYISWSSDSSANGDGWEICAAGSGSSTGSCDSQDMLNAIMLSCCPFGQTQCQLPSSCSSACAVTLPAFVNECSSMITGSGGQDLINLATTCCLTSATPACAGFSGGGGPPPPPAGAGDAFIVTSGPCTILQGGLCVGRPYGYDDNELCQITAASTQVLGACPVFDTEQNWDHLTIQGAEYDGDNCPQGIQLDAGSVIEWYSDSSASGGAWEICADPYGGGH